MSKIMEFSLSIYSEYCGEHRYRNPETKTYSPLQHEVSDDFSLIVLGEVVQAVFDASKAYSNREE